MDFAERFSILISRQRRHDIRKELLNPRLVVYTGRKYRYYRISKKLMDMLSPYDADIRENVEWQKEISEDAESRIEINPNIWRLVGE